MKYSALFFDLDNTIWDFHSNSLLSLQDIFKIYDLEYFCKCDFKHFYSIYAKYNDEAWTKFALNMISIHELKLTRFKKTFAELGYIISDEKSMEINDNYLNILPTKAQIFPGVIDVLETLRKNHKMHILSNGFYEVQINKLKLSGLETYFDKIITSESAGVQKPNVAIFDYAFDITGATRETSIYIGDEFNTDIVCAFNAGVDNIWVNRKHLAISSQIVKPTYEVDDIGKILSIIT